MIPNSLPGLDFGLGNDIDMLRETVGAFSRDSVLWRLDWILILAVAGLCFIGSLLV